MSLTIAQMALMSRLLDEALPLDTDGRRRWLDTLSPEYLPLADALREALLPAAAKAPGAGLLASGAGGDLSRIANGPGAGDAVGPYRLIRLLGEGGMAEVWLAQRADGAFKREVALKLPTLLYLRKDLANRFARERDILAALEHPNIARLYDAGVSDERLPYLAMEYVPGEPLTSWCDAHQLDVRQRLKLFLQVLDAVQYAHSQHVIHRDIKPSNILVTATGQVRLLDFGIAKLLIQEEAQTELTRRFGGVLTPDYASPEAVRGEEVGAPSDVYSLGVVLYELLTGNRPYRLEGSVSMPQLEHVISSVEVRRASTRLAPGAAAKRSTTERKLARRLKGDLDAILLRALAKSVTDRYESATAFADDLQRSLSGEPVEARPDRVTYRCGKFVLRHRTEFVAVTATLLAAVALGYALKYRFREQSTAVSAAARFDGRALAVVPAEKSIAVLPFTDMSEHRDQEYFSDGLSEELIDHLVRGTDLKVIARTSSFQFRGVNEDVRTIASKLGVTHVLEGSVRKDGQELRISAQLIRASDGVDVWSQSYNSGLVDIFKVQDEIAEKVSRALQTALRSTPAASPPAPDIHAYDLVLEGHYLEEHQTLRDVEKAAALYRQAVELDSGYALAWARLAHAYLTLELLKGPPTEEQSRRVLETLEQAFRQDPNLVFAYYTRGAFEVNVAWDWAAAQADIDRARGIDPRSDLLPSAFGDIAFIFGRVDRAIEFYRDALARNPLGPTVLDSLGVALCASAQYRECLQMRLRLMQFAPQFSGIDYAVGLAHLHLRELAAALQAMSMEPDEQLRLAGFAIVDWALKRNAESNAALAALTQKFASIDPYRIAEVHATRGEIDDAFRWLDRAYREHDHEMPNLRTDPLLENLRGDRRFQALLGRMRLTDEARPKSLDGQI